MFLGTSAFAEVVSFTHWDSGHGRRTSQVEVIDNPTAQDQDRDRVALIAGVSGRETIVLGRVFDGAVYVEPALRKRLNESASDQDIELEAMIVYQKTLHDFNLFNWGSKKEQ